MSEYKYGMRLRGFSPGCQPMKGFIRREDDQKGKYWDVLVYDRLLTDDEMEDYELDLIGEMNEMIAECAPCLNCGHEFLPTSVSVDGLGSHTTCPRCGSTFDVEAEMILTEAVEVCPFCEAENVFANWDVKKQGYVATCWQCGREIFLCDECLHADDNTGKRCDWHSVQTKDRLIEGHCFRGRTRKRGTFDVEAG